MFYTQASAYEGEPVRLYRTPMEIRRDIAEINEKISKADGRLNIRVLLGELMTEYGEGDPEEWLPELARLLSDAEEVLSELTTLKESLERLNRELEDTVWIIGI